MENLSFLGDVQRLSRVGWGKVGNKAKLSPASAGAWAEHGKKEKIMMIIAVH